MTPADWRLCSGSRSSARRARGEPEPPLPGSSLTHAEVPSEIVAFKPTRISVAQPREHLRGRPAAGGRHLARLSVARPDFLALAVALERGRLPGHITLGGHFATFASDDILRDFPEVDSICGRKPRRRSSRSRGRSSGSAARRDPRSRPARPPGVLTGSRAAGPRELPWPDRRGEPARCFGHGIAPLVSSRGCYANCTFCCIAAWHEQSLPGKRYRVRERRRRRRRDGRR